MGGIKKVTRWNRVCPVCGNCIDPYFYVIKEVKKEFRKVCIECD